MKNIVKFQLIILLLFPLVAYPQMEIDMQSANVYKQNLVYSREQSNFLQIFDEQGRLVEGLSDTLNRTRFKYSYLYNAEGKLINRIDSFYVIRKDDLSKIVTALRACEYKYENNILKSSECKDKKNRVFSKSEYFDNGKKVINKQFLFDSLEQMSTTLYDSIGYTIHNFGYMNNNINLLNDTENENNKDSISTWDYKNINEYKKGRLIKTTSYSGTRKVSEIELLYNSKGLLVEIILDNCSSIVKKTYKYEYRKK